jgi:hypothetical protein
MHTTDQQVRTGIFTISDVIELFFFPMGGLNPHSGLQIGPSKRPMQEIGVQTWEI